MLTLGTFSCIKTDFNIDDYESQIVVDGWIENDKYAKVLLTRSAAYFSDIDSISIRGYVLTRAKVELTDGKKSETLTLKPNDSYFPPYIYEGSEIKGEIGKTYYIKVTYGGREVSAQTTIPTPVILDEAHFQLNDDSDQLGYLSVNFSDDANTKNYYRTLAKIKSKDSKYLASYIANFTDDYFNGQQVNISIYKGNKTSINNTNNKYFILGDTISLMFTTIDHAAYDFWTTFSREALNTGNPFASTNLRVKTNIKNGLGIWCGYGSSYYQIIAK